MKSCGLDNNSDEFKRSELTHLTSALKWKHSFVNSELKSVEYISISKFSISLEFLCCEFYSANILVLFIVVFSPSLSTFFIFSLAIIFCSFILFSCKILHHGHVPVCLCVNLGLVSNLPSLVEFERYVSIHNFKQSRIHHSRYEYWLCFHFPIQQNIYSSLVLL